MDFSTYSHVANFNLTATKYKGGPFTVYLKATTSAYDGLTNSAMIAYKKIVVTDREIPTQPFENQGIYLDESSAKFSSYWVNKDDDDFFVDNITYKLGTYYWGDTDPYVWTWKLKYSTISETSIKLINEEQDLQIVKCSKKCKDCIRCV